jgi:hypothetical protein
MGPAGQFSGVITPIDVPAGDAKSDIASAIVEMKSLFVTSD